MPLCAAPGVAQSGQLIAPETASMRPSGSFVRVGYQRAYVIGWTLLHVSVAGSKIVVALDADVRVDVSSGDEDPPVRHRRVVGAEEVRGLLYGTWVSVLATGSHTWDVQLSVSVSKISSFPFGSMLVWTGTIGHRGGAAPASRPVPDRLRCSRPSRSPGADVVSLPAASRAIAVRVCELLPARRRVPVDV